MSTDRPGTEFQVHRLTTGRTVAYLLVIAVLAGVFDAGRRHALSSTLPALLVLLGGCALAYVLGLRPAVLEDVRGVEVRNPMRTIQVPWTAITDADVTDVLRLHAGDVVVRCFAVPRRRPPSVRRARSAQSYGFALPPKDPDAPPEPFAAGDPDRPAGVASRLSPAEGRASQVATRLRRMAAKYGEGSAPGAAVTTEWAPDSVAALVAAVVLVVAGLLVAVL